MGELALRLPLAGARREDSRAYLEQMRTTIDATGRLTEAQLDPAARDALLEVFRG